MQTSNFSPPSSVMGSGYSMAGGRSKRTYSGAGCLKLGCGLAVSALSRSRSRSMRISSATSYSVNTQNDPRSGAILSFWRSGVFESDVAQVRDGSGLLQCEHDRSGGEGPADGFEQAEIQAVRGFVAGWSAVLFDQFAA